MSFINNVLDKITDKGDKPGLLAQANGDAPQELDAVRAKRETLRNESLDTRTKLLAAHATADTAHVIPTDVSREISAATTQEIPVVDKSQPAPVEVHQAAPVDVPAEQPAAPTGPTAA